MAKMKKFGCLTIRRPYMALAFPLVGVAVFALFEWTNIPLTGEIGALLLAVSVLITVTLAGPKLDK